MESSISLLNLSFLPNSRPNYSQKTTFANSWGHCTDVGLSYQLFAKVVVFRLITSRYVVNEHPTSIGSVISTLLHSYLQIKSKPRISYFSARPCLCFSYHEFISLSASVFSVRKISLANSKAAVSFAVI